MRDIHEVCLEIAEHIMDVDRGRQRQHQYGAALQQDIYNALVAEVKRASLSASPRSKTVSQQAAEEVPRSSPALGIRIKDRCPYKNGSSCCGHHARCRAAKKSENCPIRSKR